MINYFPNDPHLDVPALSQLFDRTTNSYKLVFFQALLNLIRQDEVKGQTQRLFFYKQLTVEMLAITWYPHRFYRLSFGVQDQIATILDRLDFNPEGLALTHHELHHRLKDKIAQQYEAIGADDLMNYVPYRLLTPFFAGKLRGVKDHLKDRAIVEDAACAFETDTPALYRFNELQRSIEIHPDWYRYILSNFAIINGWVNYEWVRYLQKRNPSAPAIVQKISLPEKRSSLAAQREYWRLVMHYSPRPIQCIYSGKTLSADQFSLDHFLPWSFVCHDQLWNLVPADASANSSKGKVLPDSEQLDRFIETQYRALEISYQNLPTQKWEKATESFISDLYLTKEEILNPQKVLKAYHNIVMPLITLARQMGF